MPADTSAPRPLPWGGKCEHLDIKSQAFGDIRMFCHQDGYPSVSYFVCDVVLTADPSCWCYLNFFFLNRRATLGLTWEVHCSVLVRVSTGIITTKQPGKQT